MPFRMIVWDFELPLPFAAPEGPSATGSVASVETSIPESTESSCLPVAIAENTEPICMISECRTDSGQKSQNVATQESHSDSENTCLVDGSTERAKPIASTSTGDESCGSGVVTGNTFQNCTGSTRNIVIPGDGEESPNLREASSPSPVPAQVHSSSALDVQTEDGNAEEEDSKARQSGNHENRTTDFGEVAESRVDTGSQPEDASDQRVTETAIGDSPADTGNQLKDASEDQAITDAVSEPNGAPGPSACILSCLERNHCKRS